MGAQDISWWDLMFGYLLLAIPIFIARHYKMGVTRETLFAAVRMTVQLFLVGVYLEVIFKLNNWALNLAWLVVMLIVSSITVIQRTKIDRKLFLFPVLMGMTISIVLTNLLFIGLVLRISNWMEASYLIPITGMLLGNSLADLVTSFTTFYTNLHRNISTYRYALGNGATHEEALRPFVGEALKISINRGIANMTVMGLVSLPGMMTGQILGGSSPQVAIKYQILIMLMIFISSAATIFLSLYLARRRSFDAYKNPLI